MHIADMLAAAASASAVAGFAVTYAQVRAGRRHDRRELQRKLDIANQGKQLNDAMNKVLNAVDDRFNKNDELTRDTTRRVDRLEDEQFGPNHGGARQAINELTVDVKGLAKNLATVSERVVRVETIISNRIATVTP